MEEKELTEKIKAAKFDVIKLYSELSVDTQLAKLEMKNGKAQTKTIELEPELVFGLKTLLWGYLLEAIKIDCKTPQDLDMIIYSRGIAQCLFDKLGRAKDTRDCATKGKEA